MKATFSRSNPDFTLCIFPQMIITNSCQPESARHPGYRPKSGSCLQSIVVTQDTKWEQFSPKHTLLVTKSNRLICLQSSFQQKFKASDARGRVLLESCCSLLIGPHPRQRALHINPIRCLPVLTLGSASWGQPYMW